MLQALPTPLHFAGNDVFAGGTDDDFFESERILDRMLRGEDIVQFFQSTSFGLREKEKNDKDFDKYPRREDNVGLPS